MTALVPAATSRSTTSTGGRASTGAGTSTSTPTSGARSRWATVGAALSGAGLLGVVIHDGSPGWQVARGAAVVVLTVAVVAATARSRAQAPGGDAATLYRSIRKVLSLPATTRLHLCHDYPPAGRAPAWVSTVAEQRARNIHIHDGVSEVEFVDMRTARDRTLAMPTLMLPAVQINVRAGNPPPPEDNGVRYLKIPLDLL